MLHKLYTTRCMNHIKVIALFSHLFSDSGVGAGIDSYYEYLMKAYILLGDNVFLERFNIVSPPSLHVHTEVSAHDCPFSSYCGLEVFQCPMYLLQHLSATALQCHHEVHQPASPAAQCTHAQPHCERAQLDGLSPGILSWLTGQACCLNVTLN